MKRDGFNSLLHTITIAETLHIYTLYFRQSEAAHNRYENDITDLN